MPTILGMVVGLFGAGLLFAPGLESHHIEAGLLTGFVLLQVAMSSWSFGSILQRRNSGHAHPVIAGAVQQFATGLILLPLNLLFRQTPTQWSARGIGALAYLIVFGSIVGYSAYVYAMDRLPVAVVSIYPYVNAMLAVALGRLVYGEPFGPREATAMVVIFTGVAMVKMQSRRAALHAQASNAAAE
jgi:drug/metabolite transporter (DMT)-like permease